jgi:type II restriction/modification system DNA methylase subunit YeeA
MTGLDVTRRFEERWVIDLTACESEQDASLFARPFEVAKRSLEEENARRRDAGKRELRAGEQHVPWWKHQRPRGDLRDAISDLDRFVVTTEVAKHRVFVFAEPSILISGSVYGVARDDDMTFGILHSRLHEHWALRMGTSLEDRPRYTPTTTFETFPFPEGLTPNIPASQYANDPRAIAIAEAARELNEKREAWLNPPEWVERVPEVVPGYPDLIVPKNEDAAKKL